MWAVVTGTEGGSAELDRRKKKRQETKKECERHGSVKLGIYL